MVVQLGRDILVKNLDCSVLVAQTEVDDEEFAQLLAGFVEA